MHSYSSLKGFICLYSLIHPSCLEVLVYMTIRYLPFACAEVRAVKWAKTCKTRQRFWSLDKDERKPWTCRRHLSGSSFNSSFCPFSLLYCSHVWSCHPKTFAVNRGLHRNDLQIEETPLHKSWNCTRIDALPDYLHKSMCVFPNPRQYLQSNPFLKDPHLAYLLSANPLFPQHLYDLLIIMEVIAYCSLDSMDIVSFDKAFYLSLASPPVYTLPKKSSGIPKCQVDWKFWSSYIGSVSLIWRRSVNKYL